MSPKGDRVIFLHYLDELSKAFFYKTTMGAYVTSKPPILNINGAFAHVSYSRHVH